MNKDCINILFNISQLSIEKTTRIKSDSVLWIHNILCSNTILLERIDEMELVDVNKFRTKYWYITSEEY